jgi:hypothetical protein
MMDNDVAAYWHGSIEEIIFSCKADDHGQAETTTDITRSSMTE